MNTVLQEGCTTHEVLGGLALW